MKKIIILTAILVTSLVLFSQTTKKQRQMQKELEKEIQDIRSSSDYVPKYTYMNEDTTFTQRQKKILPYPAINYQILAEKNLINSSNFMLGGLVTSILGVGLISLSYNNETGEVSKGLRAFGYVVAIGGVGMHIYGITLIGSAGSNMKKARLKAGITPDGVGLNLSF